MISVKNLHKRFDGGNSFTLVNASFSVNPKERVSLIGSNGAGKSTLMRCCLRLIEPDSGSINLFGTDIMGLKQHELREIRSKIGFIFQHHNLVPRLSVLTNVIHGSLFNNSGPRGWFQSLATNEVRKKAMECIGRVGLSKFAHMRADKLSGGQSQRIAIARTLMQNPKMILADEPVASLDPNAAEEVMELFSSLVRDNDITLVFTSHSIDHALKYSDRVIGLKGGKINLDLPSSELAKEKIFEVYA